MLLKHGILKQVDRVIVVICTVDGYRYEESFPGKADFFKGVDELKAADYEEVLASLRRIETALQKRDNLDVVKTKKVRRGK